MADRLPDKPKVLTLKVQAEIVRLVGEGNYFSTACTAAGTTRQAVDYWRRLYEDGAEHAQEYADFFAALARAQAIAETNAVRTVRSGRVGWQGDAWFLDRRFRNRWGNKQRIVAEVTTHAEEPFQRIDNPRDSEIPPPA